MSPALVTVVAAHPVKRSALGQPPAGRNGGAVQVSTHKAELVWGALRLRV
ncbi:MAG TPA: hypothetical protein VGI49_09190 [Mycobacterium sp.]